MAVVRKELPKERKLHVRETISFCRLFFLKFGHGNYRRTELFVRSLLYCLTCLALCFSRINVTDHFKLIYYITLHCVLLYCILVKFLRNFDSMVSRSVKATPLLLLWTWKTMKSEIYVIGYRLGVRFSLQSSPLVTDSHLGLVQAHKYFFLNSDTFFQLSAVSCLKQWYVRLRSRLIKLIQSRLSFACFEIKIPNQCSILFKK